jgi:hypothetical protein
MLLKRNAKISMVIPFGKLRILLNTGTKLSPFGLESVAKIQQSHHPLSFLQKLASNSSARFVIFPH